MLSLKRQEFAHNYAMSGNGTASAISAGYSANSAHAVRDAMKKPSPTPSEIQEYLGLYFGTFELYRKVEIRNGMLHYSTSVEVSGQAGPPIALEPTAEPDTYRPTTGRQSGDIFVFNRSAEGAITSITSEVMVFRKLVQMRE